MLDTKKAHELDIVELAEDLPEYGVKRGERGVVVEVFDEPEEAYILEFVDKSGKASRLAYWVKPNQIINTSAPTRALLTQNVRKSPWHSINQSVHHDNDACQTGSNIDSECLRQGTGGRPLCQECAMLDGVNQR